MAPHSPPGEVPGAQRGCGTPLGPALPPGQHRPLALFPQLHRFSLSGPWPALHKAAPVNASLPLISGCFPLTAAGLFLSPLALPHPDLPLGLRLVCSSALEMLTPLTTNWFPFSPGEWEPRAQNRPCRHQPQVQQRSDS